MVLRRWFLVSDFSVCGTRIRGRRLLTDGIWGYQVMFHTAFLEAGAYLYLRAYKEYERSRVLNRDTWLCADSIVCYKKKDVDILHKDMVRRIKCNYNDSWCNLYLEKG